MKTLCLVCFLIIPMLGFGKIWIVDSNAGSTAKDFTNLQAAHDGAAAGDTLYLIGSSIPYDQINLSKRLVMIGPGYFLNENLNLQSNINPALVGIPSGNSITFAPGSEGSVIMGLTIRGVLSVNVSNILIKRNRITFNVIIASSNVILVQNYINSLIGPSDIAIKIEDGFTGIIIKNNYISNNCANGCGAGTRLALFSSPTTSLEISNNIFFGNVTVSNAHVQNNITLFTQFTATASLIQNNSGDAGNYFPPGTNNFVNGSDFAGAFVPSGTTDSKWQLGPSSQLRGTGFNGVDRGIFGGSEPYVLSGIPPIPTIYSLTAPTVGEKNTGLPIQIKVKSNN
jgi:hypothetical protein